MSNYRQISIFLGHVKFLAKEQISFLELKHVQDTVTQGGKDLGSATVSEQVLAASWSQSNNYFARLRAQMSVCIL